MDEKINNKSDWHTAGTRCYKVGKRLGGWFDSQASGDERRAVLFDLISKVPKLQKIDGVTDEALRTADFTSLLLWLEETGKKGDAAVDLLEEIVKHHWADYVPPLPDKKSPEERKLASNQLLKAKGTDEIEQSFYEPLRWFVAGLLTIGLTLLAGGSKVGKSWLLLQMCLAIAKGFPFLGFSTTKTKVIYLALEDSERRIQSRMKMLNESGSPNLKILTKYDGGIDALLDDIPALPDVGLIVIDIWGRFVGKLDHNDYSKVTEKIAQLHTLAKERNIALVVCSHTKKGKGEGDWLDSVIGSTAHVGVADCIWRLTRERNSNEGKLDITGRDVNEDSIGICRDENWRWRVLDTVDRDTQDERSVLEIVENYPLRSAPEIKKASRTLGDVNVESVLYRLETAGQVTSEWVSNPSGGKSKKVYSIRRTPYPQPPKTPAKSGVRGTGYGADTIENENFTPSEFDPSPLPEFDQFSDVEPPEFLDVEPTVICPSCQDHVAGTFSTKGLCNLGYAQTQTNCSDFRQVNH